jgi:predicted enzyme related to lactoylglutathione lyase
MTNALQIGRIIWHDCMTPEPDRAITFYTKLFGWTITTWDGAGTPYHQWTNQGRTLGGSMRLPEEAVKAGAVPHWMMYVLAADADASFALATSLGATVFVPVTAIPSIGRFAVLADPQGAAFALFQPVGEEPRPDGPADVGEFSWHELATTDHTAALAFYGKLFGWEAREAHDMGPMGIYQLWGRPGVPYPLGGMFIRPPEIPANHWLGYVRVTDIDASANAVKALGGQVLNGPMDVPGGDRVAQCADPLGAMFALHWLAQG